MKRAAASSWIIVLALMGAIAPLSTDMYLPALPAIAADLHTTATGVQFTITAFLVGLALGQLVIGPLSDGWGRRRLLVAGTAVCAAAGVAVALAPTIEVAVAGRFVQGFGGAAGLVLARAVIVDRTSGPRMASLFALLMAIGGVAPVAAPLLGSALVGVIGWRGLFFVLAGFAALLLVGVLVCVGESLPPERRHGGGVARTLRDAGAVLRRPVYLGHLLAFAFSFAALFAYVAGSPFVLQGELHLSSGGYALVFAVNAAGIVLATLLSARLARRVPARRQLRIGLGIMVVGSAALLAVALGGAAQWPVLVLLFVTVSALGLVLGNAAALASAEIADVAGTGSALLGAAQFGLGAVVSPLVGASATRMAVTLLVASAAAAAALLLTRLHRPAAADGPHTGELSSGAPSDARVAT